MSCKQQCPVERRAAATAATSSCLSMPGLGPDVICRKYAEGQHLSSMSEANYKKVMIESESIRVLCVCVALLSILRLQQALAI